ncbi:MAG: ATP-binding cassette domain-containing protein [Phycisphaerales bacterium]|nr:ATP-binding cassette domain-containing protein [Phycisphaerales bacterium]
MIDVRALTKHYGGTVAVDRVTFQVAPGKIVGFLGPNGAGKSTTMKMLCCYLAPTAGTALIDGFDIFHQSVQVRRRLGYLPENVPLYPEMKVREYLDFRARLRGLDRTARQNQIGRALERCWLKSVEWKTIGHLSKGYRQRVGLADALLHNPPVLILDEPTVGLDPSQIVETRKLIRELGGDHTVLLSTHILPEVEAVCDDCVVIAGGRIVARGSPDELRQSRRMQARVLVECRGPAREVRQALERVSGVAEVQILTEDASNGRPVVAALRQKDGYDVREEAARTVIQHGWPLREIRLEHATLEEFFVQVTAEQAARRVEDNGG